MKIIIADSSTLIALLDSGNFALLFELFDEIIISDAVYQEITRRCCHEEEIARFITSGQLTRTSVEQDERYEMLRKRLDIGESESIALAKKQALPLIIDERKGRKIARDLGIAIIGFVGILLKLLEKKIITKARAIAIVKTVEENDFRLSDGLKALIYEFSD